MTANPHENRPQRPHGQSGGAGGPPRRKRKRRGGKSPQTPRPAANLDNDSDGDLGSDLDQDDDDLTLPSYGKRFDQSAQAVDGAVGAEAGKAERWDAASRQRDPPRICKRQRANRSRQRIRRPRRQRSGRPPNLPRHGRNRSRLTRSRAPAQRVVERRLPSTRSRTPPNSAGSICVRRRQDRRKSKSTSRWRNRPTRRKQRLTTKRPPRVSDLQAPPRRASRQPRP